MQKLSMLILSSLLVATGYSQASIAGLTCATQGTQYQYIISGADSATPVQVCVTGGVITGTGNTCVTNNGMNQVQVTWNSDSTTSGTVTLTAGTTNQTLNIVIIAPLGGSIIDTAVMTQFIDSLATPANITCPAATGGACSPGYAYQWQQSPDNMTWANAAGATGQNLVFTGPLAQSAYYRRQTTETVTGTIAYSNSAVVFLVPPGGAAASFEKRKPAYKAVAMAKFVAAANKTRRS